MNRFLEIPNNPVPIPRNATVAEERHIVAGNLALRELSTKKKERQRITFQQRIKQTDQERFDLGKLAAETSTANAVKKAKIDYPLVNESTIRNFRKSYLLALAKDRTLGSASKGAIPKKKMGRPLLFGSYDQVIVDYTRRLRRHGTRVNSKIVMGTARGIVIRRAHQLLHEKGGEKKITRDWARSLLLRIKFSRRKGTRKAKKNLGNEEQVALQFHNMVHTIIKEKNIPPCLVITADEQFSAIVPGGNWTMAEKGSTQVEIAALDDKREITLFPAFSGDLKMLDPQLIYHGTTTQCHPDVSFPDGYVISHSKNHWSTELTCMEVIDKSFHPYCVQTRQREGLSPEQWALLLWDAFRSHLTKAVRDLLKARRIQPAYVPPNYTHSLSPPDQFVQKELKEGNAHQFQVWYKEEITDNVRMEHLRTKFG